MLDAGIITDLVLHPRWHFEINGRPLKVGKRRACYTADFSYNQAGRPVVEDVKGVLTRDAALRIALMDVVHGVSVVLIGRSKRKDLAVTQNDAA